MPKALDSRGPPARAGIAIVGLEAAFLLLLSSPSLRPLEQARAGRGFRRRGSSPARKTPAPLKAPPRPARHFPKDDDASQETADSRHPGAEWIPRRPLLRPCTPLERPGGCREAPRAEPGEPLPWAERAPEAMARGSRLYPEPPGQPSIRLERDGIRPGKRDQRRSCAGPPALHRQRWLP